MENSTKPDSPATSAIPSRPASDASSPQRPAGGEMLAMARQGAHVAVDAAADKAAPVIDAVHDKVDSLTDAASAARDAAAKGEQTVKGALDQASATADEWLSAARDAIRANPIAAVGGALLVGAAYISLTSRRR